MMQKRDGTGLMPVCVRVCVIKLWCKCMCCDWSCCLLTIRMIWAKCKTQQAISRENLSGIIMSRVNQERGEECKTLKVPCVFVCVCVCERERESEWVSEWVSEWGGWNVNLTDEQGWAGRSSREINTCIFHAGYSLVHTRSLNWINTCDCTSICMRDWKNAC